MPQSSGIANVDKLIQTMMNPSAPYAQKAEAATTLETIMQSSPTLAPAITASLKSYGLTVQGGQIKMAGQDVFSAPQSGTPGVWGSAMAQMTPPRDVRTASDSLSAANKASSGQGIGLRPASTDVGIQGTSSRTIKPPGSLDNGFNGGNGGMPSATQPNSGNATSGGDYSGTFFGNAMPASLQEIVARPGAAEALWRTRGGPDGGSLANSSAAQYGSDDFQSAMVLGDIFGKTGGGLMTPPDQVLGFTNDFMGSQMGGGGQYADPAKIMNQIMAAAQAAPDEASQRMILQQGIESMQPFMTPMSYQMLQSRLSQVMDEYTTYGLENGTADLSGRLLQEIQRAIGV
jgi:hypothetical protein